MITVTIVLVVAAHQVAELMPMIEAAGIQVLSWHHSEDGETAELTVMSKQLAVGP